MTTIAVGSLGRCPPAPVQSPAINLKHTTASLNDSVQSQILRVAAVDGFEPKLPQAEWSFTNNPAEFMAKFPYGKIPAFEGTEGFKLIEGTTIARYHEWPITSSAMVLANSRVLLVSSISRFGTQVKALVTLADA